jgi:hypothetical protein
MLRCNMTYTGQTGQNGANVPFAPQAMDGANGAIAYRHCPVPCPAPFYLVCKCEENGVLAWIR